MTDENKLRWFQFSLRSLFILMTVCAVLGGIYRYKADEAEEQRVAVEVIRKIGGSKFTVYYDCQIDEQGYLKNEEEQKSGEWARNLLGIDMVADVVQVDLGFRKVNNEDMNRLANMTELVLLGLEVADIGDDDLKYLVGMTKMEHLFLSGNTQISDIGLKHLVGMTKMRDLTLTNTEITDEGLKYLAGMKNLKWLHLEGTHVTPGAIADLHKVLPHCTIDWNGGTIEGVSSDD